MFLLHCVDQMSPQVVKPEITYIVGSSQRSPWGKQRIKNVKMRNRMFPVV